MKEVKSGTKQHTFRAVIRREPSPYALDLGNNLNFVGDMPAEPMTRQDAMGNPVMPRFNKPDFIGNILEPGFPSQVKDNKNPGQK